MVFQVFMAVSWCIFQFILYYNIVKLLIHEFRKDNCD